MKRLLKPVMTILAIAFLAAPALVHASEGPVVGEPAPDFAATDIKGTPVKLSDLKDKIVVLEWNNPECPFVIKHYDTKNMQGLQEEATGKGVVWISINSSAAGQQGNLTAETAQATLEKNGGKPSHYVLDASGEIGRLYQAKTTPHMFVINKDGVLAYAGAIDSDPSPRHEGVKTARNHVRSAIDALIAGQPVETATTQPYGCNVKYGTN